MAQKIIDGQFPSPCGEKVGINIEPPKLVVRVFDKFPSPCGEKVGINANPFSFAGLQDPCVSVPLRGKGRDQLLYP